MFHKQPRKATIYVTDKGVEGLYYLYMEYHSDRSFVGIGSSHPLPVSECDFPPKNQVGERHTRLRGKGWGDPISKKGQKLWYFFFLYTTIPLWIRAQSQLLNTAQIYLRQRHWSDSELKIWIRFWHLTKYLTWIPLPNIKAIRILTIYIF